MTKQSDRLALSGIVCRCHIGVTDEERRERQKIEVDLELFADLEEAGRTGDLKLTVDYREVCDQVRGMLESGLFNLVEAAARGVLDLVFTRFPVQRARVRIRKFVLPDVTHVEVQMERTRDS